MVATCRRISGSFTLARHRAGFKKVSYPHLGALGDHVRQLSHSVHFRELRTAFRNLLRIGTLRIPAIVAVSFGTAQKVVGSTQ